MPFLHAVNHILNGAGHNDVIRNGMDYFQGF